MTKNHVRKQEIRARMAQTNEPYSVAARHIDNSLDAARGWKFDVPGYPTRRGFNPRTDPYEAAQQYPYAWYPGVGFYNQDTMEQVSLVATEDQIAEDGVANWYALLLGLGASHNKVVPDFYAPLWTDHYAIGKTLNMVPHGWAGELSDLAELGFSVWKHNRDKGYFCYNKYVASFTINWISQQELLIEIQSGRITEPFGDVTGVGRLAEFKELLDADLATSHDHNEFTGDGIESLVKVWAEYDQEQKTAFVRDFIHMMETLPDVSIANTPDVVYAQYHPRPSVPKVAMEVGDLVKLKGNGKKFEVRAVSENFVVLTQTRMVKGKERIWYTILDWKQGVRGAHNSYGWGATSDEKILAMIKELERSATVSTDRDPSLGKLEVSWRNRVPLVIESVKKPKR